MVGGDINAFWDCHHISMAIHSTMQHNEKCGFQFCEEVAKTLQWPIGKTIVTNKRSVKNLRNMWDKNRGFVNQPQPQV